jgi:hypothetical protein
VYGGAARPTLLIDPITRFASIHSAVLLIWLHHLIGGGVEETFSP